MIKALILDIDGVLVGEKVGYNSPDPHPEVLTALKYIRQKGIPITLCTAKPHYAIDSIINQAKLSNPHITDGGAVIINSVNGEIVSKHIIPDQLAYEVVKAYLTAGVYTEFYTLDGYYAQNDKIGKITEQHTHILKRPPVLVPSLIDSIKDKEVTKIMPIAKNEVDKKYLAEIFRPFVDELTLSWGVHPVVLPHQFGIITAKGISKKQAAEAVVKSLRLMFEEILGVGDSTSDWQFIEPCKYGAAMGNASGELKRLVQLKSDNGYIGPTVDENGTLEIFKYFKLI